MKQDRFLTGILAGIVILIVLALALFFVRSGQTGYVDGSDPEAVLHNYVVALDQEDYERAYSYVAAGANFPSYNEFRASMSISRRMDRGNGLEIDAAQIDGNEAVVPITVVSVGGGPLADTYRSSQIATLTRQEGSWKITSMAYQWWDYAWSPADSLDGKPRPVTP